jgi:hypothetical protein
MVWEVPQDEVQVRLLVIEVVSLNLTKRVSNRPIRARLEIVIRLLCHRGGAEHKNGRKEQRHFTSGMNSPVQA